MTSIVLTPYALKLCAYPTKKLDRKTVTVIINVDAKCTLTNNINKEGGSS